MYKENINLFSFIKEHVTILQVISEHVELKKVGYYYKGCCPFHSEKTASFTVSPHREIFYCFGCHAGGDVIAFLGQLENCQPFEAAQLLVERYGITLPENVALPSQQSHDEKKRYFKLCELVALWAHENLKKFPSAASYCEKRGMQEVVQATFTIGFFPDGERSFKSLIEYIKKDSYFIKDLLDAGIVSENSGRLYSPFENRIIFPITDNLGRFCGFGGRIFKPDDERVKYYNSRENNYFQKGHLVFGFDQAKRSIQKEGYVFLVEGYTDCIAMVQAGHTQTVATLGTACTIEHLKLLSHYAQTVYVMYDGDSAGHQAMLRLVQFCWQVALEVKVITLPAGDDPASFLQKGSMLDALIQNAQDIFTLFLEVKGVSVLDKSLQEKVQATKEVLEVICSLEDPLKKDFLIHKAAQLFGVSVEVLTSELSKVQAKKNTNTHRAVSVHDAHIESEEKNHLSIVEKKFFSCIFNNLTLLNQPEVQNLLEYVPETIQSLLKKLELVIEKEEKKKFIHFFDMLNDSEKKELQNILMETETLDESEIDNLVMLLEKKYWKLIVARTKLTIEKAQQAQDSETVEKVVTFFLNVKKKLLRRGLI